MLEVLKIILFLACSMIGILIWLFSGVIAWEFVKWLERRKKEKENK